MEKHKEKYWIEIRFCVVGNKRVWIWVIKCCNGREKAASQLYEKRSYCFNDAKALAKYIGLEIRG